MENFTFQRCVLLTLSIHIMKVQSFHLPQEADLSWEADLSFSSWEDCKRSLQSVAIVT